MFTLSTGAAITIGVIVLIVVLLICFYTKASPNVAKVISGLSKKPRYLVGRGGFRVPLLEKVDRLYLGQITIDIKTAQPIPTNDCINIMVDAVSKIQINYQDPDSFEKAIKNFLNCSPDYIAREIKDTFEGNLRESVGAVALKDLIVDRDAFSDQVLKAAGKDLSQLGLVVLSCNIQNITDQQDALYSLGIENLSAITANASITKANADRDVAIARATAEKEANDALVASETAIAEKQNELKIKKADLKREADTRQAEADAAYEIQKQDQLKTINEKTVDANIAKTKREQLLADEEVILTENKLKAEVNKKADAEKYKMETNAAALLERDKRQAEAELVLAQKKADAQRYAIEQEALAIRAKAEAERFAKEQEAEAIKKLGEASAYKIEQEGLAEAEKVKAVGLAEAEALEKKAEAFDKFGQAAILDTLVKIIPEVSKNVAEPMSAIQNLNVYSSDGSGASSVTGQMPTVIKQTLDVVKSLGVPVDGIMEASTKSAKTDRNIDINGEFPVSVE